MAAIPNPAPTLRLVALAILDQF